MYFCGVRCIPWPELAPRNTPNTTEVHGVKTERQNTIILARMKSTLRIFVSVVLLAQLSLAQKPYFPAADAWERRTPEQAKIDSAKLKEAIDFAIANEA